MIMREREQILQSPPYDPTFLQLRVIKNAILVPRADFTNKALGAGVLHKRSGTMKVVTRSGIRRRGKDYVLPPPLDAQPKRYVERAVYGGFLFRHFGHFLLESLGRLWLDEINLSCPIIWLPSTANELTPWMTDMLHLTGIHGASEILSGEDGAVEIGELLIADQGFEVERYLHPWFSTWLQRIPYAPKASRSHVWLSRSALGDIAGVQEEAEIEGQLAQDGWIIAHLEEMTISEQVTLFAQATHISGIEGSAFHNLLFVSDFAAKVDIFTRHHSPNFEVIGTALGIDQQRHSLVGGTATDWKRPNGSSDRRWSGIDVNETLKIIRAAGRR